MTKRSARPNLRNKQPQRPQRQLPPAAGAAAVIAENAGGEPGRIVKRPDGFHWIALDGRQEFGPFETLALAMADLLDTADEDAPQPGEALQEAESEMGIADWIDPETGDPAEGSCPPHLGQE
jgi:hypothetical protein